MDDDSTVIITLHVDIVLLAGGNKGHAWDAQGTDDPLQDVRHDDALRVLEMLVIRDIQAVSPFITRENYTRRPLAIYGMKYCRPLGTPVCPRSCP